MCVERIGCGGSGQRLAAFTGNRLLVTSMSGCQRCFTLQPREHLLPFYRAVLFYVAFQLSHLFPPITTLIACGLRVAHLIYIYSPHIFLAGHNFQIAYLDRASVFIVADRVVEITTLE